MATPTKRRTGRTKRLYPQPVRVFSFTAAMGAGAVFMIWLSFYGVGDPGDRWISWVLAAALASFAVLMTTAGCVLTGPEGVRPGKPLRRWTAREEIVDFGVTPPANDKGKRMLPGVGAALTDGSFTPLVGITSAGAVEELLGLISKRVATSRQRAAERIIRRLNAAKQDLRS